MLGTVFARFVEKSPIAVMARGTLERVLGTDQLDAWLARTAQKQYTRTLLFLTVYDVLGCITRQHESLPCETVNILRSVGRVENQRGLRWMYPPA